MNEIQDVPLDADTRAALELVLERDVAAVLEALRAFELTSLGYAVCLDMTQEDEFSVPGLSVGLEHDRAAILARGTGYDAWRSTWTPNSFTGGESQMPFLSKRDPEFAAAQPVLEDRIGQLVPDAQRWVLNRVARAVSRAPMPFPVTADFVCYVIDIDFSDLLLEQLRFSAPPEAQAQLVQKGLLPRTVDDLPGFIDLGA